MIMKKTTITGLIGLLITTHVLAEKNINADNVTVTASRFEDSSFSNPSVKIITQEDILNSPSIDIPDLLRNQAGINIQNLYGSSGIDTTIDMRGFGDAAIGNTLFLVDGQRLNAPDSSSIQWANIPINSIKQIEIMPGDGTILFGDRATSGVINFITDKSGTPAASLTTTFGSYGYKGVDGYFAGGLINGGYFNSFIHTSDDNGYRINSAEKTYSLGGVVGLNLDTSNIYLNYSIFHQENGLPGLLTATQFSQNPRAVEISPSNGDIESNNNQVREGIRLRPGFSIALTPSLDFSTEFLVADEKMNVNYPEGLREDQSRKILSYGITPKIKWAEDFLGFKNVTVAGFDYYFGKINASYTYLPSNDYYDGGTGVQAASQTSQSIYLQDTISITPKLDIVAGTRTEQMRQTASQTDDVFEGYFGGNISQDSSTATKNAYQLTANYHDINWGAYAKTGTSFRFATLDDLFGFNPITYTPMFFGGFIKPQSAYNNEIGVTYKDEIKSLRVTVYHTDVTNEIGYNPSLYENINLDPTKHAGIETQGSYSISSNLTAKASYTYQEAKFTSGAYSGNSIPMVPSSMGNAQLLLDEQNYGTYVTQLNYVGPRYYSGDFTNTDGKLPSYVTMDLKASWDIKPYTIRLTGMNVFDKKYAQWAEVIGTNYYAPANGRVLYLSLTYDFK
jgi:iron complex outermembrane recepter protein